jgi:MFS transporter, UMF1 family
MLLILLTLNIATPIYGLLGFILPFGLKQKWEIFPVGIYYGVLYGAIQSFFRVLFAELIPKGRESEFFAVCYFLNSILISF